VGEAANTKELPIKDLKDSKRLSKASKGFQRLPMASNGLQRPPKVCCYKTAIKLQLNFYKTMI